MNTTTATISNPTKKEVAKMIKQAITINANTYSFKKEAGVKPLHEMTDMLGEQLIRLLTNSHPNEGYDWGSILWGLRDFMKAMLVLLAKPGILNQLQEHYRPTAADTLECLMSFFEFIDTPNTRAFLDYAHLPFLHMEDKDDAQEMLLKFNYYDFSQHESRDGGFFGNYTFNKEKRAAAIAFYNENIKVKL